MYDAPVYPKQASNSTLLYNPVPYPTFKLESSADLGPGPAPFLADGSFEAEHPMKDLAGEICLLFCNVVLYSFALLPTMSKRPDSRIKLHHGGYCNNPATS